MFVRDFSAQAITLHGQASANDAQREWALAHVRNPVADSARFDSAWNDVAALSGAYEMRP